MSMKPRATATARRFGTTDGALYMWLAKPQLSIYRPSKHAKRNNSKNHKKKSR